MNVLISQTEQRSWVEIDVDQLVENLRIIKESIPSGKQVMAVIKADAYGHGDIQIARILHSLGVNLFAVSNIDEAVGLRSAGIVGEILILGYTSPHFAHTLARYDLTQAIVSDQFAQALMLTGERVKCQVAIDTGMNRIGLDADDIPGCVEKIRHYAKVLDVTGMFTHLCASDGDSALFRDFTLTQMTKFSAIADALADMHLKYVHCYNSAGAFFHHNDALNTGNVVRIGIILYGLKPDASNVLPEGIKPLMTWRSTISMVKDAHPGEYIGYGLSYKVDHEMRIATITTGYADGFSRHFSNKGFVMIKGHKAPICGKVCMDQIIVDVTEIPNVKMGDKVVIMGSCGNLSYTAEDMATDLGTISYEVVCNISKRVQRFYRSTNIM